MFNPVAPYRYLLPTVYLFMVDIANPDLFVCGCRTCICLAITHFYEEQRQPSSGSAWLAYTNNGKSGSHCCGPEISTQFAQQFVTAVTALPLVCCVVWSPWILFIPSFQLECGNSVSWPLITHPASQKRVSLEWLIMSQRGGELSGREKHDGVYSCLCPVYKWKNLNFGSSQDHSFIECL